MIRQEAPFLAQAGQFRVDKSRVKRRVVGDDLAVPNKLHKLVGEILEQRLVFQVLAAHAMLLGSLLVYLPLRVEAVVKDAARRAAVFQFHATKLNEPVPLGGVQAGCFRV